MKRNKLIQSKKLQQALNDFWDPFKMPEGWIYFNPYYVKWKRGRPSKEAIELREWAAGWDLYFYEQYPRLRLDISMFIDALGKSEKIKVKKGKRTLLVKYNQMI